MFRSELAARTASHPLIGAFAGVVFCAITASASAEPSALHWVETSEAGHFEVTLEAIGTDGAERLPIGRIHDWLVRIASPGGPPVDATHISINGGMPGHGHGLPTQPEVTERLARGTYRIEGMKFNMAGDWVLAVLIETRETRDRARFEIAVEY